MTGQHDRRVELLAGQDTIVTGHCPLTGCYSEPCLGTISKFRKRNKTSSLLV